MHIADACSYQPDDQGSRFLTPDPSVVGNEANRYIRRSMDQVKSVVIMAHIPGAVVKSVPWPSGTLDLTPDQKLQRFRLPTRVSSGQGSSW